MRTETSIINDMEKVKLKELTCLKAIGISKKFKNIDALSQVHLSLYCGELHTVLGAKGSGKTTLLRILAGAIDADSGYIEINNRISKRHNLAIARKEGIQSLYESQFLMQDMTAAENIFMGEYITNSGGLLSYKKLRTRASEIFKMMDIDIDPDELPVNMSEYEKQLLQLARVYACDAKIVLADNIASMLTGAEKQKIFSILQGMASSGIGVVYFTHLIEDALKISDRITVMRQGTRVSVTQRKDFDASNLMMSMVGCDDITIKCLELTKEKEDETAFFRLSKAAESNENLLVYLKKAVDYIDEHLDEQINPKCVADAVHLSSGYLMMLFKTHMNMSIMEYTHQKRMDNSKELLKDKSIKISQIASMVGISNSQYFSVLFKKSTGMTPNEYRKTNTY